ncbi:hypothetical protein N9960_00570 [Flavobacteriaceae bacterium]|nr:hypothetical protein [Flavobacteriaceae bacterium]
MKTFVIIQARMGSSRYPGKILELLREKTPLWYIRENLKYCNNIYKVIVATTNKSIDDETEIEASKLGFEVFRGDENNVFSRYLDCCKKFNLNTDDLILRLTADDIFIDPTFLDAIISLYISTYPKVKFATNANYKGFPYGFFFEIFDFDSLCQTSKLKLTSHDLEHVTPAIKRFNKNNMLDISITNKYHGCNLSFDTKKDKIRIESILEEMYIQNLSVSPMKFNNIIDVCKKKLIF